MNKKNGLKIGFFQPQLIYPRGAERQICELASQFSEAGYDVFLFTFSKKHPYQYDYLLKNVSVVSLNKNYNPIYSGPENIVLRFGYFYFIQIKNILYVHKMSKLIKRHNLDVLNVHNYPGNWLSFFSNIPVIWTCNEPPYWIAYKISFIYKLFFFPMIIFDRYLSRRLTDIFVLSNQIKNLVDNAYLVKSKVIGSGANLIRKIKHVNNTSIDILSVGELHEKKRPEDILIAISRLSPSEKEKFTVHFVGDGIQRKNLEKIAQKNHISCKFYGRATNSVLYNLFDRADIAIFSPEKEPWGIFPIEMLIAGVPLICSDEVGFLSCLNDKEQSVVTIYPMGNINELLKAIRSVSKNLPAKKKVSNMFKRSFEEKFSWKNLQREYERYLNKIVF